MRVSEARRHGWGERAETFAHWYNLVDAYVTRRLGLGVEDFPDWDFASSFESGDYPEEAAEQFIEDMMAEFGL